MNLWICTALFHFIGLHRCERPSEDGGFKKKQSTDRGNKTMDQLSTAMRYDINERTGLSRFSAGHAGTFDESHWMTEDSATYGLGGSSVTVSWTSNDRMQARKFHGDRMPHGPVTEPMAMLDLTHMTISPHLRGAGITFEQFAKSIDWSAGFSSSHHTDAEKLIADLLLYVEQEHPTAIQQCPGERETLPEADCVGPASNGLFTGQRQSGPAFVVDVSVFGFDLDQFEVKLHELNDVVDLFVIYEMPLTHKGERKPLVWARNKDKSRFAAFQTKILHVVIDDADVLSSLQSQSVGRSGSTFLFETTQEQQGNTKMTEMVHNLLASPKNYGREVVVNFGDADEISLPQNLALLKHCQPTELPIDSGLWMPMGRLDRAFQTDWPLPGLPYTFGNPSAYSLGGSPRRMYGRSGRGLIGGWHLTNYAYPPHRLMKELIDTTYKGISPETAQMLQHGAEGVHAFFEGVSTLADKPDWKARTVPIADLSTQVPYKDNPNLLEPPRTLQCNPERFETWFGQYDRRLSIPL